MHVKSSVLDYDTVIGDALHIQKILLNLLSNAVNTRRRAERSRSGSRKKSGMTG